jgi:hypothetical protein
LAPISVFSLSIGNNSKMAPHLLNLGAAVWSAKRSGQAPPEAKAFVKPHEPIYKQGVQPAPLTGQCRMI